MLMSVFVRVERVEDQTRSGREKETTCGGGGRAAVETA